MTGVSLERASERAPKGALASCMIPPQFEIAIHARPTSAVEGVERPIHDRPARILAVEPAEMNLPFPCSFEELFERLERIPRFFAEPDGSFVWTGMDDGTNWQLEGNLYDLHGRVIWVSVKGFCPESRWRQFIALLGEGSDAGFAIQLLHEAVYLSQSEFLRWQWDRDC